MGRAWPRPRLRLRLDGGGPSPRGAPEARRDRDARVAGSRRPAHDAEELAALPRPLVAYGLVEGATAARRLLELVDAVVVAPAVAVALGGAFRSGTSPA